MSVRARVYLVICGAVIGYALGYALPAYAHLPRLHYDPLAHRFLLTAQAGPIPMGYLGLVLYGVAGALLGGAAVALGARRRPEPSGEALALAALWALTALVLVGVFFTWQNWP